MPSIPEPVPVAGYAEPQFEVADLACMKPEFIVEQKIAGRLDRILGVPPRAVADRLASGDQLTRDDLRAMSPDEVLEAKAAGRLDDLLGTTTPTNS